MSTDVYASGIPDIPTVHGSLGSLPIERAARPHRSPNDHQHTARADAVAVIPARYVLLPLANAVTGYSVKAMQRKIERGDWLEGKVWRQAPDGRILIDLQGYQRWVEGR